MLPTPSTSHVNINRIYEPAEDSFLLLDTLSSASESLFLKQRFNQGPMSRACNESSPLPLVVEVGTGSGVVLAFITANAKAIIGRSDILSIGIDINQYACKASVRTIESACGVVSGSSNDDPDSSGSGFLLASLNADLTSAVRPGSADILIFNPPYVPTAEVPQSLRVCSEAVGDSLSGKGHEQYDEDARLLSLSYAGGTDGMEVTNRLLEQLPALLNAERGVAYILLCKQNKPEEVVHRIRNLGSGWTVDVVGRSGKHGGWEKLQILRICRQGRFASYA